MGEEGNNAATHNRRDTSPVGSRFSDSIYYSSGSGRPYVCEFREEFVKSAPMIKKTTASYPTGGGWLAGGRKTSH